MDLAQFMTKIKEKGLARTNRFRVTISTGGIGDADYSTGLQFMCVQASMPGISLTLSENEMSGSAKKVALSEGNDDVDLVFYVSADMKEKMFFDDWMASIVSPMSHVASYYDDYVTGVLIETLDLDGNATYAVELYEAHPVAITPIALDASEQDAIMKIQATLTFKKAIGIKPLAE